MLDRALAQRCRPLRKRGAVFLWINKRLLVAVICTSLFHRLKLNMVIAVYGFDAFSS
jgi:hypothetical protein